VLPTAGYPVLKMSAAASPSRTISRTAAVTRPVTAHSADLLRAAPLPTRNVAFVSGEDGLVGWGEHARIEVSGPFAAARIRAWFDDVVAELDIADEVGATGCGPVAFVSLGFDDSDTSVAVVPAVLLGRRDGVLFSTVIGTPVLAEPTPISEPGTVTYADASLSVAGFTSAVAAATERIRAGELAKVVLAHDLEATAAHRIDERYLLARLAAAYPSCWTYAVDGLIGASPEMLIHRIGDSIASRVLAGTAWSEHRGDPVAATLMSSEKNLAEHALAVASVADVLAPVADQLLVPEFPHPLALANLTHLATDIVGSLGPNGPTALELAARLHPTAAVGGTPAAAARQLIRELEPMPRGRYAGPVGWISANGDGEFAIALRCAQVSGRSLRLMAGCGIVADSDPEIEAREAQVKMIPVREALEG
jgi:menaquinone-specific isochorismate synthase